MSRLCRIAGAFRGALMEILKFFGYVICFHGRNITVEENLRSGAATPKRSMENRVLSFKN
jgi:hypothetical protein